MQGVNLVIDLNSAQEGFFIRGIRIDLEKSCHEFPMLGFVTLAKIAWKQTDMKLFGILRLRPFCLSTCCRHDL